jgi:hypothetical protein
MAVSFRAQARAVLQLALPQLREVSPLLLRSNFLNLRVTDIRRYYNLWSSRAAKFITEPKVHATEFRCYMRDPDGYLIEVGQTTITASLLELYA